MTDNYYNCTVEIFRGLGDLYVQDERFTKSIDKDKTGYAEFLREAMHYYCDNLK
ncbi:TipAS antibiotic-recognition domain-containing protein [Paenibacillus sp. J31TS4]|uniref:TipAS antibiotic-recognition domain-containing protein n=1 Tax=Paenibacillus sp. J31TS4 TaxID=2807195 RepID=UPI001BCECD4D|nr:TipAS antibiotic-recognition domain-containing protein [Paenibacillus sp. J31TS4]